MVEYDASKMSMPDWVTIGGKIQHAAHNAIKAFKTQFDEELIRAFAFDVDRDHVGFCFDTPENYQRELEFIKDHARGGLLECVGCFRYQAMNEKIYHVIGLWDTDTVCEKSLRPVFDDLQAARNSQNYMNYDALNRVVGEYNRRETAEYSKLLGDVLDILISDNAFSSLKVTDDFFLGFQHHDDRYFTIRARLQNSKWVH